MQLPGASHPARFVGAVTKPNTYIILTLFIMAVMFVIFLSLPVHLCYFLSGPVHLH
jgi:hypothetical protein